jgi:hypothetical protein
MKNKTVFIMLLFCAIPVLTNCSGKQQTPPPNIQFQTFKLSHSAGPCYPGDDCGGFIELSSDGTLSYDKFGELPEGTIHTTSVTQAEFDAAVPVLTDNSLIALLDLPGEICPLLYDIHETMTLWTMEGKTHSHATAGCSNQSIKNARQILDDLANSYFP